MAGRTPVASDEDEDDDTVEVQQADYEAFVGECERLRHLFGLAGWQILYELSEDCAELGHAADVNILSDALHARVRMATRQQPLQLDPPRLARHEMTHLLLWELERMGKSREFDVAEFDREIERVCRVLELAL